MAQMLTLSQVRQSSQFAWHPLGYLLVDGELFRAVRMEPPASGGYRGVLSVKRSSLHDDDHTLNNGWRHAEGCTCELCTAEVAVPLEAGRARAPDYRKQSVDRIRRLDARCWGSQQARRDRPLGHGRSRPA